MGATDQHYQRCPDWPCVACATEIARATVPSPLDEQTIRERASLLMATDDPRCEGCGRGALFADDAGWLIDSQLFPNASPTGPSVVVAIIRCPECW